MMKNTVGSKVMKLKARYQLNKSYKVGESCVCPSCGTEFTKTNYQQVFCKSKPKTQCKDKYWNTVTPKKRNNTTRISPASARWMNERIWNLEYKESPLSSEALGQW